VTQPTEAKNDKEAEPNSQQRIEERLYADAIDYVNEQAEAKEESERLQPEELSSCVFGTVGFRRFREFFCFLSRPVVHKLFFRFHQCETRLMGFL
jgi:hypothetical protein